MSFVSLDQWYATPSRGSLPVLQPSETPWKPGGSRQDHLQDQAHPGLASENHGFDIWENTWVCPKKLGLMGIMLIDMVGELWTRHQFLRKYGKIFATRRSIGVPCFQTMHTFQWRNGLHFTRWYRRVCVVYTYIYICMYRVDCHSIYTMYNIYIDIDIPPKSVCSWFWTWGAQGLL